MVRPLGKLYVTNVDGEYSISIENNGIGPLIIKSVKIERFTDEKYTSKTIENWSEFNIKILNLITNKVKFEIIKNPDNYAIFPGKSFYLTRVTTIDPCDSQQKMELKALTMKFGDITEVNLEYTDIYGKNKWVENKTLDNLAVKQKTLNQQFY